MFYILVYFMCLECSDVHQAHIWGRDVQAMLSKCIIGQTGLFRVDAVVDLTWLVEPGANIRDVEAVTYA